MNIQEASIATGISKDMIRFYEKKKDWYIQEDFQRIIIVIIVWVIFISL